MGFFHEAESWVLVAFILFVGLLVYLKVPAMATRMLDDRGARIAKELEEKPGTPNKALAAKLFAEMMTKEEFTEFLTIPAYDHID